MLFKKFLMSLCFAAACAIPAAAFAQPFHHGCGEGPGGGHMPMMMLLRNVNLTADQQAQVHKIMDANFTEARPLMKQLHSIHEQIADKLMGSGNVSEADLTPLQTQENQVRQQLDQQMMATALKIRGVLTPAQLAKASELHTKMKALHAQMEALMGEDGPPPPMGPPAE
ncbi:MAG TPA: periplasmic heavy metal sensor [Candidatus Binataceae bacterium]|nr:periplasmic heavy metal sensor [Candidatus Binataceae bacterium]